MAIDEALETVCALRNRSCGGNLFEESFMITYYVAASRNDSFSKASTACEGHGDLQSVKQCISVHGAAGDYPVARENGNNRCLTPEELKQYEAIRFDA